MVLRAGIAGLLFASAISGSSQNAPPRVMAADQAAVQAAVRSTDLLIPAKSIVEIEITEPVSSKVNNLGDTFTLKLAEPFLMADRTVLPAGLTGRGEVTHAAKSGWGGKAGELIVNARYVKCGDIRIPLGHFHYAVAGKNNVGGAMATSQVIPLGQFLVSGHEAIIAAGSRGTAQVSADVTISSDKITQCTR